MSCPGSWPELRQAGRGFALRGALEDYYTTIDPETNIVLGAMRRVPGPAGRYARRESRRRDLGVATDAARERAFAWDMLAVGVNRLSGKSELHRRALERRDLAFDAAVARDLRAGAELFIGQAGACRASLERGRQLGMRTMVNWNIQHWATAAAEYEHETNHNPAWAPLFTFSRFTSRTIRRYQEELDLADLVLTPSSVVVDSFVRAGYAEERFRVVPYGVDAQRYQPADVNVGESEGLRVIFVGELGQRKGLSYFFEIARRLPHMRFTAVGWWIASLPDAVPDNVLVRPNVYPLDVIPLLQGAQAMVFPSLLDGFGLVALEGMACGLPVICSSNAGASDVITDGSDGWIVPSRDVEHTVERLKRLDGDRTLLVRMAMAARQTALERPWERFHRELMDATSLLPCGS